AFEDDPRTGVLTTAPVLAGAPILMVSHDEDDGGWQFLCGTTNDPADGRIVHLADIVAMDPTVESVADLPLQWVAYREAVGGEWHREPR
ncbi:MAG: hypothetical protein R3F14_24545, partial [Polyangiaceae bacterium]